MPGITHNTLFPSLSHAQKAKHPASSAAAAPMYKAIECIGSSYGLSRRRSTSNELDGITALLEVQRALADQAQFPAKTKPPSTNVPRPIAIFSALPSMGMALAA